MDRSFAELLPEIVWTADSHGYFNWCNQRWRDYTGVTSLAQTPYWKWEDLLHPDDLIDYVERWKQAVRTGDPYESTYRLKRHDGSYQWYLDRALRAQDGTWVGTLVNVDEQIKTQHRDALTGLANRRYMDECLRREVRRAIRRQREIGAAMIDIDHFKKINDTHGHDAGDIVLKQIASILSDSIRSDDDYVFRMGGEEFLVVLPEASLDQTVTRVGEIAKTIRETPMGASLALLVTVSVGVAAIPPHGTTPESVLKAADSALYAAKAAGRDRIVVADS